jgi:hypothetical protein
MKKGRIQNYLLNTALDWPRLGNYVWWILSSAAEKTK